MAANRSESGQSLVETALCALLFWLFIFGTFDFGFLYYTKVTLQNAVRQAARYAVTGNCTSAPCFDPSNGSGDRLNTILQTVSDYSFGLNATVSVSCIQGSCLSTYGYGTNNAGGPGDTVQISAQYTFRPIILHNIFTGGSYTYTVSSTFQNEHFAPPAS